MAHGYFNVLGRRTRSNAVSQDKVFEITSNEAYTGHQRGFASMF